MQVKLTRFAPITILVFALGLCGCLPAGHSQLDEEKESHYLAGKSRYSALDYDGALECYEKAIEVNPRSALAHLEAGFLYERHKQDHAAAIYHFDRFLRLKPDSQYAGVVNQHILACKAELAKTVLLSPINESFQKQLEQLQQENKIYREEIEAWRAKARVQTTNVPTSSLLASASTPSPVSAPAARQALAGNSSNIARVAAMPSPGRTHTVKSGDTPASIARRYGVKIDTLMAANPRVDARRLHIGQSLNVPSQ
jgi:LysM repeat protein